MRKEFIFLKNGNIEIDLKTFSIDPPEDKVIDFIITFYNGKNYELDLFLDIDFEDIEITIGDEQPCWERSRISVEITEINLYNSGEDIIPAPDIQNLSELKKYIKELI